MTPTPGRELFSNNVGAMRRVPDPVRRSRRVVAALLIVASAASACGGSSSPTDLDGDTTDALATATDRWIDRYRTTVGELDDVSTPAPAFVNDLLAESGFNADTAERLLEEGAVAGAYRSAVRAAALATGVGALDDAYAVLVEQGDLAFTEAIAAGDTAGEEVGASLRDVIAFEPANVSQAAALTAGYATALDAASLALLGVELLERPGRDLQEQLWLNSLTGFYLAVAPVLAEAAAEQVDLGSDLGGPPITGDAWAAGDGFRAAANVSLDRFQDEVIGDAALAGC